MSVGRLAWLIGLTSALLAPQSPARAVDYTCSGDIVQLNLVFVFSNGMFTDLTDAQQSAVALRARLAIELGVETRALRVDVAYNSNEATSSQLWQVAKQRGASEAADYIRNLRGGGVPGAVMRTVLGDELKKMARAVEAKGFANDTDLDDQVKLYALELAAGRKVIVVAHSQGNFYANAAYGRLIGLQADNDNHFAIVSVANPAAKVATDDIPECDGTCYTSLTTDLIIQGVRAVFPDTLAPNVTDITAIVDDIKSHAFRDAYLASNPARRQILRQIRGYMGALPEIKQTANDAMISADLSWDEPGDLDLHVFENDGEEHVWYKFPEGQAGFLSQDSQQGPGIERYVADCMPSGIRQWRIGVGYFSGTGPATAVVRLHVGNQTEIIRRVLPMAEGAASQKMPVDLATLGVLWRDLDWQDRDVADLTINLLP